MPTRSFTDLLADAGEGGSYEPLPEGDYDFVVAAAETKTASTGRTMYVAKCEVEAGPNAKSLVWHNFVITPDNPTALGFFFRNMNALGLGREFFATNPGDHQVAEALKGRRFRGQVVQRAYQGQMKNEIKAFWAQPNAGGAPAGAPAAYAAAPVGPPAHAAPPAVAQAPAPPPPPAPAPAPAPAVQAPAAPPVAEAAPAPAAPPAPPVAAPAPTEQPAPQYAGASAGAGDVPPPPPF